MRELTIKLERVRKLLQEQDLDAIYVKRQDNFAWLTCGGINHLGTGEMGNCGLLVTMDNTYAITDIIEYARMKGEELLEELGFTIYSGLWYESDFQASTLKSLAGSEKIGFDHHGPFGINIMEEIKQLRFSLTDEEMERYRKLGFLASLAIEETASTIKQGDTEKETVDRLLSTLSKYGLTAVTASCAADERIENYRHAIPTSKVIKERAQLGGNMRYKGLTACCSRYVNFVPISEELATQYKKNVEIDCIFMGNTIPGESYQKPFLAGQEAYIERGYEEEFTKHHQGGPTGYQPRDYRIDFSHTGIIQQNQPFCWNPSITGTKSEDTIVATSNGIEMITKPIIFPTIEVEVDGVDYKRAGILQK